MIFDTHAHYNDDRFLEDREEIFASFKEAGIGRVCNIASDIESIKECLDLADRYPFMYCALEDQRIRHMRRLRDQPQKLLLSFP